jgi:hypothetical protein
MGPGDQGGGRVGLLVGVNAKHDQGHGCLPSAHRMGSRGRQSDLRTARSCLCSVRPRPGAGGWHAHGEPALRRQDVSEPSHRRPRHATQPREPAGPSQQVGCLPLPGTTTRRPRSVQGGDAPSARAASLASSAALAVPAAGQPSPRPEPLRWTPTPATRVPPHCHEAGSPLVRPPRGSGAAAPYLCGDSRSIAGEVCGWGGPASRWWRWVTVRAEVKLSARSARGRTSLTLVRAVAASFTEKQGGVSAPGSPSRILGAGQRGCVRASAQPYLGARTRQRTGPATRCWIRDRVCAATQSLEAAGGKAVAAGAVRA